MIQLFDTTKYSFRFWPGIFLLTVMPLLAAESVFQSHDSIKQAAREYLTSQTSNQSGNIKISIGRLDSRLSLARCDKTLHAFSPPGSRTTGRTTVGIRCEGSKPWNIFVTAQVGIFDEVVVANRNISRGAILTASDLRLDERDLTKLHRGYITDINQAIGKTVKQSLHRDKPLSPSRISAPNIITRGNEVTILSDSGAVQVRMKGKALGNGSVGDRIQVMNTRSKRKVEAKVISSTEVRVDR